MGLLLGRAVGPLRRWSGQSFEAQAVRVQEADALDKTMVRHADDVYTGERDRRIDLLIRSTLGRVPVAAPIGSTDDSTGFPSWRSLPARIAASNSIMAGLKFWVVARNSCIGTPSIRSRWDICADCHGSYPALTTLNRLQS
jgi:hypothetical protein